METNIGVTFMRHGRSGADDEGVHEGRYDSPLTDTGRTQAEKRGKELLARGIHYQIIITSPLQRAQETARILAKFLDVPVEINDDWIEMNNGSLAGLAIEEAEKRYPKPVFRSPYDKIAGDGESEWELYSRAARVVDRLVQRGPGEYMVVTHGRILNAALRAITGVVPWGNDYCINFRFGDLGMMRLMYLPRRHRWLMEEFQRL
jgi:2,3-bisphosphoglycerate-dependent phosphoglycerate mutase